MTKDGNDSLDWDENGRLTSDASRFTNYTYNWDGKLRSVVIGANSVNIKYDPLGNRVQKNSTVNGNHRYIVDIASAVPKVLLVLDADNNDAILTEYVHTNREILMQYDNSADERYYYLHDRLGSVRLIVDDTGSIANSYMYDPWGKAFDSETQETVPNDYRFAGYFWDNEPKMYYCLNRYYDPELARFVSRDPVKGKYTEPLTLHKYLYCGNDSINRIDPDGRFAITLSGSLSGSVTASTFSGLMGDIPYARMAGKAIGGLMSYYCLIMPLAYVNSTFMAAGSIGGGIVAAKDTSQKGWDKGWSFGTMMYGAGGNGLASSSGGSLTMNVGYSPNAQRANDLAGRYLEVGGSVAGGVPPGIGGVFFNLTGGFSYARGDNGVELWTGSLGTGSRGVEAHVYSGYTSVDEW